MAELCTRWDAKHPDLEGVIERVTFHNEENGWSVLKVAAKGAGSAADPVPVLGNFTSPTAGESVRCRGAGRSGRRTVIDPCGARRSGRVPSRGCAR